MVVNLGAGTVANTARILLLGDSNTEGFATPGGYRLPLFEGLFNTNDLWVDFVGDYQTKPADGLLDSDHQGLSGIRASTVLSNINTITANNPHDIAVMLLGTNDIVQTADTPATIVANLLDLLRGLEAANPNVTVLMGTIPAINGSAQSEADAVNALLPSMLAQAQSEGIDVTLVDLSSLDPATDYFDALHPNAAGYAEMASLWLSELLSVTTQTGGTLDGNVTSISGVTDVVGSQGADRLTGSSLSDTLDGFSGNDYIEGLLGSDNLFGGDGDDFIFGGDGGDIISGDAGDDTIEGGSGTDTYVFDSADLGSDIVTDFETGETVQLSGFGYADAAAAALDFSQVGNDVVFSNGGVTVTFEDALLADVTAGVAVTGGASSSLAMSFIEDEPVEDASVALLDSVYNFEDLYLEMMLGSSLYRTTYEIFLDEIV